MQGSFKIQVGSFCNLARRVTLLCLSVKKSKQMETDNLLSSENKARCIQELSDLKPLRKPKNPQSYAAVLVPLIQMDNGQTGLLFTKRNATLRRHAREVCYPGGKVDEKEEFMDTAKRETFEEIGIPKNSIDIWGAMPALSDHTGTFIHSIWLESHSIFMLF